MKKLFVLLVFVPALVHAGCDFKSTYPQEGTKTLSNGVQVPYPTHATDLDTFSVFGYLNLAATELYLKVHGLTPVKFLNHAIGILSVYDYKSSDLGAFREAYFIVLAHQGLKPILFHVQAFSSLADTALASDEIWGIPSRVAAVIVNPNQNFTVGDRGGIFSMQWVNTPKTINPFGLSLKAYAAGTKDDRRSLVRSCGPNQASHFDAAKGDALTVKDLRLKAAMTLLNFEPILKEQSLGAQAVQFLPAAQ